MSVSAASLSFDVLFQRHQQELLKFAGKHSNDEIAEDLVQEAYIRLMRQAQTENIENPRAYLFKVTHNLSIDYLRQGQVRSRYLDYSDIDLEHVADSRPDPEADIESQSRLQQCLDALESLPEVYRHVFLLHRFDGMTYNEIGTALNLPGRKSTLLNIIALLDRPTSGRYVLNGLDVVQRSDDELARIRRENIGFVFQFLHVIPSPA